MTVLVLWGTLPGTTPTAERRSDHHDTTNRPRKGPGCVEGHVWPERIARERGIERKRLHLIKTRVSQINGCAYCIDMHTKDARAEGETEQRRYSLSAWREAPFYTARERAALEWAETLTLGSMLRGGSDARSGDRDAAPIVEFSDALIDQL
jgi:AhpD family alkylhydroperoxidase